MKIIIFISIVLGSLLVAVPVFAAEETQNSNLIQNQNQIQTQNQGEMEHVQASNQEQENLNDDQALEAGVGTKSAVPRNAMALERMSNVAKAVEQLLTTQGAQGGIGDQVRQVAQEQKQAQDKIQIALGKIASRTGLLKFLIGPDYGALKNVQKQIEQNQLRIRLLQQLQNQLSNQNEIATVQETVQALTEENTTLQDQVNIEEKSGSLFGWLFKLFNR